MMDYRKVPTRKLMQRLDVLQFKDEGPLREIAVSPQRVRIPLQQHVGAPAMPVVEKGDSVKKYDLIAKAAGKISANVHAAIDGKIAEITTEDIIIQRS
jgi:Na+-translocating ferredoxin:NAD+ oxidoreductase RnfC subunit